MKKKIYRVLLVIYCISGELLYGKNHKSIDNQSSSNAIVQDLSEKEMAEFFEEFDMQDICDAYENGNRNRSENTVETNSLYSKMVEMVANYGLRVALLGLQAFWATQDACESIKQKYSKGKKFLRTCVNRVYEYSA